MMIKVSRLAIVIWLAAQSPAAAIVGPTVDASVVADSVVMILTRGAEGSGFCTGVVLTSRIVLTAAHCLRSPQDTLVHFRQPDGQPIVIEVVATQKNPAYRADAAVRRTRSLDVGLIETREPFPARFKPLSLASEPPPGLGAPLVVAGYGLAAEGRPATGGSLRATELRVREPNSPVLLWLEGREGAAGACSGDSGGPVLMPQGGAVAAIIAWTEGAAGAHCGKLTQAILVAPILPWIASVLRQWRAEPDEQRN